MNTYQTQITTAFDIFSFEDVNISEWVSSPNNIILKSAAALYAFDRNILYDYMIKKKYYIHDENIHVYETPLHQSISPTALAAIENTEYSFYELINPLIKKCGNEQKTIYDITCYYANEWSNPDKKPDLITGLNYLLKKDSEIIMIRTTLADPKNTSDYVKKLIEEEAARLDALWFGMV